MKFGADRKAKPRFRPVVDRAGMIRIEPDLDPRFSGRCLHTSARPSILARILMAAGCLHTGRARR